MRYVGVQSKSIFLFMYGLRSPERKGGKRRSSQYKPCTECSIIVITFMTICQALSIYKVFRV
jgi:hypothetical protein